LHLPDGIAEAYRGVYANTITPAGTSSVIDSFSAHLYNALSKRISHVRNGYRLACVQHDKTLAFLRSGVMAVMVWGWVVLGLTGALFIIKMIYVISTALALPFTQGALYVSTSGPRIKAFLDAVAMTPGQLLIDLGCGDGRVLSSACTRYGVRAVGYEINLMAYCRAWLRCLFKKGARVVRSNFWSADLSRADVLFCYLFPDVMERLAKKIHDEVKPGAIVVSCNFPIPGIVPHQVLRPKGELHHDPIYIYQI
jgi:hypothetical protein